MKLIENNLVNESTGEIVRFVPLHQSPIAKESGLKLGTVTNSNGEAKQCLAKVDSQGNSVVVAWLGSKLKGATLTETAAKIKAAGQTIRISVNHDTDLPLIIAGGAQVQNLTDVEFGL
jgi:hypothetical protein